MDFAEIVIGEVQGNGMRVVRDLFRKSVRQPSEAAHVHSHGQVLPGLISTSYVERQPILARAGMNILERPISN